MIIAGFLIASAVVRVGLDAGEAIARQTEPDLPDLAGREPAQCEPQTDLGELMDSFKRREGRIVERERALDERSKAIDIANREIERRLAALIEAEESLRATIALAETAAEDDILRLISVYENMKPKDAAALFEEMAPDFAAGFLGQMRPQAAAGIMAGLSPQSAYTISVILAGRNANVPEN